MKVSGVWMGVSLLLAMVVAEVTSQHQELSQHKVKRQIYYPPRSNDDSYESAPPRRPSYRPIQQTYKPRPTYKPKPVYQEPARPYDSSEEQENAIPGVPGVDYPIYNEIPYTKFECAQVPYRPGMYANPEAGCQVYHVCNDDRFGPRGAEFLCTNGTLFNQETFSCDWWFNVDCSKATSFYDLNKDPDHNPYYQKPYDGPLYIPGETYETELHHQPDSYQPPKSTYRSPFPSYRRP